MGCLNSKLSYYKLESSQSKQKANLLPVQGIYYHNEKDAYAKSRTLEAIRKGDLFLFQQTVQQYRVKPSELLGSFSERKGVLHMLAEHNFAQGMSYILDHIAKLYSGEAVHIINSQDSDGNTALIICCLYDSVQALEVLLSSEQVDAFVKNNAGKTGLDIALEKESICAKLVSIYVTNDRRLDNCGPQYTLNVSGLSTNWGSANKKEKEDDLESPLPLSEIVKMAESNDLLLTQVSDAVRINPATRLYKRLESQYTPEKGFTDEEFPHDNYSIGGDIDITGYFQGPATLVWERVAKVLKVEQSQVQLFEDMKANDVSQSPIAGCDFYAALAAMTEFPQRIVKVFTTKESNMFGAYSVVFLVCGIAIEIVLDDYFPCIQQQQQNEEYLMLFSKPQSNEIWFSLLEKAMAKLYGSYAAVSNVGIAEAFEMITGMPSTQFELKSMKQKELWNDLVDYSQRNYFVCVGHYRFQTPNKSKHFTIVGVKEVNDMKMVKLRFQYDNHEISRAFVNRVKKWNKDFKEKLGFFENEKDCFYVELKEFVEEFDVLTVCFYHDNWIRNRVDVRSEAKETKFFELAVEKDTEVFVSVHQKLPHFVDEGPEYKLSPVEILVAEDFGDRLQMKACGTHNALVGESTTYASDKIRFHLSQGKYIVRTQVRWTDGESHEFSLSTYSASPITCTQIKNNTYPHFLERVYTDLAARSSERFLFSNDCQFVSAWAGSHLWLCAINDGNKTWDLEVVFDTLENLKIVKKYRRDDKAVKFTMKAGEKAVVYLKRLPVGDVMLKWHFVQSWE